MGLAVFLAAAPLALGAGLGEARRPTPPPTSDPAAANDPDRALERHGVSDSSKAQLAFLETGYPKTAPNPLPDQPVEKSQLAIDAMKRLGAARSRESVAALVRIASLDLPAGVRALVDFDLEQTDPGTRDQFREKALRILQFNAVNALGLIGDPAGLPAVRAVAARAPTAAASITYALNLACLGDPSGIPALLKAIEQSERKEAAAAARVFTIATGQDFGLTEVTATRERRAKATRYAQWWKANAATFRPDSAAVLKRRTTPRALPRFTPRSVRDYLKLSAIYFDFANNAGSVDAREHLKRTGPAANRDLEALANNASEDIDVRMEAMNWLYEINEEGAKPVLMRLRKDENAEVADKAKVLIDTIDNGPRRVRPPGQ